MQKTIENFQMVKRDKLKDFDQVLKGALEYMTGSIGEELKLTMVKGGRIAMLGVASSWFPPAFPVVAIG